MCTAGALIKGRRRPAGPKRKRGRVGLLFIAPTMLLLLIFFLIPMAIAIYLSFTSWGLVGNPEFVGLENFRALQGNAQFFTSLGVTAKIALLMAIPGALLALVLAVLVNEGRHTNPITVLLFFPVVFPSVVSIFIWEAMYRGDGVLNSLFGVEINWLTDSKVALLSLALLMLWTNLGYYTVITLAGVRDIPRDIYEAAAIDGARATQRFRWITIPLMRPVLLFILMIATTDALTLFIQPYLLTQGGPGDSTRTLSQLIYQVAFMYTDVGRASAMAVVLLVAALGIAAVQFRLFRREEQS